MSLDDWLELEATQYAIGDAVNCVPVVLDLEQLIDDLIYRMKAAPKGSAEKPAGGPGKPPAMAKPSTPAYRSLWGEPQTNREAGDGNSGLGRRSSRLITRPSLSPPAAPAIAAGILAALRPAP